MVSILRVRKATLLRPIPLTQYYNNDSIKVWFRFKRTLQKGNEMDKLPSQMTALDLIHYRPMTDEEVQKIENDIEISAHEAGLQMVYTDDQVKQRFDFEVGRILDLFESGDFWHHVQGGMIFLNLTDFLARVDSDSATNKFMELDSLMTFARVRSFLDLEENVRLICSENGWWYQDHCPDDPYDVYCDLYDDFLDLYEPEHDFDDLVDDKCFSFDDAF